MKAFVQSLGPEEAGGLSARIEHGHAVAVLLENIRLHEADVIVVGKHGGTALGQMMLGSVPQALVYQATCDVLLVP